MAEWSAEYGAGDPSDDGTAPCPCEVSHLETDCYCPADSTFGAGLKRRERGLSFETPSPSIGDDAMMSSHPATESSGGVNSRRNTMDDEDDEIMTESTCDACPFCGDVCADEACARCSSWRRRPRPRSRSAAVYTPCEVRRHCTAESCWLVAGKDVFDVTKFLSRHPAGTKSIARPRVREPARSRAPRSLCRSRVAPWGAERKERPALLSSDGGPAS